MTTTIDPTNNAHLKIGEVVICIQDVSFSDNTQHKKDTKYTVEPSTQA